MQSYSAEAYGEAIAAVFDFINDNPAEVASIVGFLEKHVGDGPVLEAGIGTGRIAIPLAAKGVELYGVDISKDMVDQLLAKPGAERITVEVGDMNDIDFGKQFSLVYLAQGTFGALLTDEAQRRFLQGARKQLADGGKLVIETMEVDDSRFTHDQYCHTSLLDVGHVVLSAAIREPQAQLLSIQNVLLSPHGIQLYPVKFRYYTAAELDDMAAEAGLKLLERHNGWGAADYQPGDLTHVSVYGAI